MIGLFQLLRGLKTRLKALSPRAERGQVLFTHRGDALALKLQLSEVTLPAGPPQLDAQTHIQVVCSFFQTKDLKFALTSEPVGLDTAVRHGGRAGFCSFSQFS